MPRNEKKAKFREFAKFFDQNKVASAAVLGERYVADYPKHGFAWLMYGESLYPMARYTEALIALRRALRLCPHEKRYIVYRRFGYLHQQRGAYGLAARWFRKGVEANPYDATDRIFLGAVLAMAGRLTEAEAIHRSATKCKEGCIDEAFLNLGMVLRALGRFTEARDSFKHALAIEPKYKEARKGLADVEHVIQLRSKS